MNKCENCGVFVYESEEKCPLCHKKMENISETNVQYPKYKSIIKEKSPLKNVPLFVSTFAILICVYINIFTHQQGNTLWSIIVSACILYVFAMFKLTRAKSKKYGSKVVHSFMLLSALLVTIDLTANMVLWSLNYVLPFLTLAVIIYLTDLALRSKSSFSEYFGYILVVIAIDIVLTLLDIIVLKNYSWEVFLTVISCIIIAIVLYLFADKSLKEEVNKRFHR